MTRRPDAPTCHCGRPLRNNSQLCDRCYSWLEKDLAEIVSLVGELTTSKYGLSRGGDGNIGVNSKSADKPLPFNDRPVELARELKKVLLDQAELVVKHRGAPWPRDTVADLSAFLLKHLTWIRCREEAGEVHRAVTHAVARLRGSIDGRRSERRNWGRCGSLEYGSDGEPILCSAPCPAELTAYPGARRAVCDACGAVHELDKERQNWLLEQTREEVMYVAQLSRTLDLLGKPIADPTIRSWVSRNRLQPVSRDAQGRDLFKVGHVLDLISAEAVRVAERQSRTARRAG